MPRLFVGVPAPSKLETSGVRNALKKRGDNVKLVDPELYHVTLAFLGDTPEDRIDTLLEAIQEGAEGVEAHRGRAQGLGAFPSSKNAAVVWIGVRETRMQPIAEGTRAALRDRGVDFDDRHDFHPHLTVARLRDKRDITQLVDPHEDTDFGAFPVDELNLYESTLTSQGPVYEVRGTVQLPGEAT